MKKIIIFILILVILGIAWYGISPLFKNTYVNDELPAPAQTEEIDMTASQGATEEVQNTSESKAIPITDTVAHPASGQVRLVQVGEKQVLRYENYKTINGPDVRVYLATDINATEFVDLGPIKGTEGNINYDIPAGTDLEKYHFALTWCEDFNVLFNSADLNQK